MKQLKLNLPTTPFSAMAQGYWRLVDWNTSSQNVLTFLKQHVELGITTTDHADIYGDYRCEALFGKALKLDPTVREQIQIVSKCGIQLLSDSAPNRTIKHYDTSAQHIIQSVNNSLAHMGIEALDVLLIHRPDCLMNADEVAEAFEKLHKDGKVKQFGVSNFTPSQFSLLQSRLDAPLVTNQVEINPLNFDVAHDGTLDQLQQLGVRPMAWSCLAGGSIFTSNSAQALRVRQCLHEIADNLQVSVEQVIFAFILKLPSRPIPILGTGNIQRVKDVVKALSVELTNAQWYAIWAASKGHDIP